MAQTVELALAILFLMLIAGVGLIVVVFFYRAKQSPPIQTDNEELVHLRERNELLELAEEVEKLFSLDIAPDALLQSVFDKLSHFKYVTSMWAGLRNSDGIINTIYLYDKTELGFLNETYGVRYISDGSEARNPSEYAFASGEAHFYAPAIDAPMNREWRQRLKYSPLACVISLPLFHSDSARPDGVLSIYSDTTYTNAQELLHFLEDLMRRVMIHAERYEIYYRNVEQTDELKNRFAFYETLFASLPIRVYWKDRNLTFEGCNQLFAKDAQLRNPDAIKGKKEHNLHWQDQASSLEANDKRVLEHGVEMINRIEKLDGMWRLCNRAPLRDAQGEIIGVVGTYLDYTLFYRAQNYHEENEQRFRELLDQMPTIAIQGFDTSRRINYWNRQSEKLYGYSATEAKGKRIDELMLPKEDRKRFKSGLANWLHHNEAMPPQEHEVITKTGRIVPVHSARVLLGQTTSSPQFYTIDFDLSLQKSAEAKLKQLAGHDALTLLPNRHHLNEHLKTLIVKAKRESTPFAIFFIDLDNFKYINDTFGHNYGDELLIQASRRLKSVLRDYDFIARFGGDEFIVTLEYGQDRFVTSHIAQKMIDALSEGFVINGEELFVGASIGIALFPDNSDLLDILLKQADSAMYEAKRAGKNQFAYFTEKLTAEMEEHLQMESALRRLLKEDKLQFYFQPQIDIQSQKVISCEALARWYDEKNETFVPPEMFIPIAEKAHLMETLTHKAIDAAVALLVSWRNLGLEMIRVDVNVPAEFLNSDTLFLSIKALLREKNIDPRYIGIEITESQLVNLHTEASQKVLQNFSRLGIHISIDDFGTGYSSLSYLSQLTINTVKIDKSFILGYKNRQNSALIRSIIAMAHELNYEVLAEGVENEEQANMLQTHHCDKIQGYLYSQPLHPEAITEKLYLIQMNSLENIDETTTI